MRKGGYFLGMKPRNSEPALLYISQPCMSIVFTEPEPYLKILPVVSCVPVSCSETWANRDAAPQIAVSHLIDNNSQHPSLQQMVHLNINKT